MGGSAREAQLFAITHGSDVSETEALMALQNLFLERKQGREMWPSMSEVVIDAPLNIIFSSDDFAPRRLT